MPGKAFLRACCDSAALPHLGEQTCLPKSGTACQASLSCGSAIAGCDSRGRQAGLKPFSSISPFVAAALTIMPDHEYVRCVSASALEADNHSPVPFLCPPRAAEGPYEGLFVSSLPSSQTWVSHKHREAPARQWEHLHTDLELNLPRGGIWLFNQLRHKMKS